MTLFLTMAYIILTNPAILSAAGMPFFALVTSTALASALGCILMGLLANLPIAVAPDIALPSFLALILKPLTFSLSIGIAWGILSYTIIQILTDKVKNISPTLRVVTIVAILAPAGM